MLKNSQIHRRLLAPRPRIAVATLGAAFIALTWEGVASAQPAATVSSNPTTPAVTTTTSPLINVSGGTALWFILAIVLGLAVLTIVPLVLDARRAEKWRSELGASIIAGRFQGPDLQTVLTAIKEPRGVRGLTRSLIALLIIVIAALALAATVFSGAGDAADLRKTVITSLMTVLATVSGFYFGSRSSESSASDARAHTPAAPPAAPTKPTITSIEPPNGAVGATVQIIGQGLRGATAVQFGLTPGVALHVIDDTHLSVQVPTLAPPPTAPVSVTVVTPAGTSPATPFTVIS